MDSIFTVIFILLGEQVLVPAEHPGDAQARIETSAPADRVLETDTGEATFYGRRFHGRKTASGERFDQNELTAAHRTYPFGTIVRVTNLRNGRAVVVRINDRGPFGPAKRVPRKIIDVSRAAASVLGFIREGRIVVRVEVLQWGDA